MKYVLQRFQIDPKNLNTNPEAQQIAARRSTYKSLGKRSLLGRVIRQIEKVKAQTRAKVEHPFRVIKRQFGYTKVRFRGWRRTRLSWSRCSPCRICG